MRQIKSTEQIRQETEAELAKERTTRLQADLQTISEQIAAFEATAQHAVQLAATKKGPGGREVYQENRARVQLIVSALVDALSTRLAIEYPRMQDATSAAFAQRLRSSLGNFNNRDLLGRIYAALQAGDVDSAVAEITPVYEGLEDYFLQQTEQVGLGLSVLQQRLSTAQQAKEAIKTEAENRGEDPPTGYRSGGGNRYWKKKGV